MIRKKISDTFSKILQILDGSEIIKHQLHHALMFAMIECSGISDNREILKHPGLCALFSHRRFGIMVNRDAVVSWFQSFSPLYIRFDNNNHFREIVWDDERSKYCDDNNLPVWDLSGAYEVHWANFYVDHIRHTHETKMSPQEAKAQRQALREQSFVQDQRIRDYLQRNPVKGEKIGKFGIPQDKYRYGFYGHQTMEYDSWGRIGKEK